ncbi:1,6-anhydro-N-acetylmuramyl-L-alanine amidase AmpD [Halomonas elongata]|uniref:1,6-anhydro-N-acetylmuramyl-L-alanine amidase AmpD n=1 Tax=Halomonas elongata (strain ATCC 33173 / DSM 2581 / NBRC 15536 / NCIMB 2198 / 1H9) TaxID=768066 RepID=E1V7L9_HALED|nr:1,6-anhydro-N-acetylmuramyl-L-alanine amidase AmpD [Halomonas elongata]WBF17202.1 1,6-anhydro-N-acetylmuramyl-L-alanine amidase AmpD [Halomonas elongata]WPU46038.1 1,6-anhydro-N-acetylmuramyl-L-alanine amidase AmpD [Halomonas elongata DSM 2581]CBV43457.1 1,6-anhydro-N-acetylmuramyl-L-alanine amidase AmpD [Halomonas elongata DSM 2581]
MPIDQGWLEGARRLVSPNQDVRPEGEISLLVLHSISLPPGQFSGDAIERLFTNRLDAEAHPYFAAISGLRVSAHLLIRRDGGCVQFVPFTARAWHAGRSWWRDGQRWRRALNDFSVGIELEGDEVTPYTEAQYHSLACATRSLLARYPAITPERITSHARVAPLRKSDPGAAFDWAYFRQSVGNMTR